MTTYIWEYTANIPFNAEISRDGSAIFKVAGIPTWYILTLISFVGRISFMRIFNVTLPLK